MTGCDSKETAAPTTTPDGAIVHQETCAPNSSTYEGMLRIREQSYNSEREEGRRRGVDAPAFDELRQLLPTRQEYSQLLAYDGFECQRITYLSDGLRVMGYIWKPKDTSGKKLPLIVYNRGGNQEFGKLAPWMFGGFYTYLRNGFVVIASQYRGNDGGEGKEEFGGADVRDVLNLIPLAKSLGYVDMNNVFVQGDSRGGMMTYLALKQRLPVNAAAVVSGLGDLTANARERPEFNSLYRQLIPDFAARGEEAMRERSAVAWAEQIETPLLILHGTLDWRANVDSQARPVAQRLEANKKPHEFIVYEGDVHGLSFNAQYRDKRIIEWFKRYMK